MGEGKFCQYHVPLMNLMAGVYFSTIWSLGLRKYDERPPEEILAPPPSTPASPKCLRENNRGCSLEDLRCSTWVMAQKASISGETPAIFVQSHII